MGTELNGRIGAIEIPNCERKWCEYTGGTPTDKEVGALLEVTVSGRHAVSNF